MSALFAPTAEFSASATALVDIARIAPMIIVAVWALLQLAADAFAGPGMRLFQRNLALAGVALAAGAALMQFGDPKYDAGIPVFSGFLTVDHFSLLLDLGILGIAAAVIAFAGDYARTHRFEYGEQETLILIATFGVMILAHAADFVALFLGIETMSIAVYVLVGARWNARESSEAALKYFLMGAFSSALLLMGIAFVYGATGTTSLDQLGPQIGVVFTKWGAAIPYAELVLDPAGEPPLDALREARDKAVTGMAPAALFFPGMLLIIAGLMFKISAVPLHMWTPDAYEGAPTPTTAFMAAGVKLGAVAAVLKFLVGPFMVNRLVTSPYGWTPVVAVIALLTMTVGNLAAVRQTNVKRLLAYSSIAHVGYLLIGVVAAANFYGQAYPKGGVRPAELLGWSRSTGDFAVAAIVYYVLTYAVATLGAFACVAWYGAKKKEGLQTREWSGVAQRHPGMALGMTICLLSLMGMPPTAGFLGKLFVFRAAFENDNVFLRFLVVFALINSVIGAYYYLRIIVAMYFRPAPDKPIETLPSRGVHVVVAVAAALTLVFGIGANYFMRKVELATAGFILPRGSDMKAQWVDRLRDQWDAEDAPEVDVVDVDVEAAEPEAGEGAAEGEGAPPE